MKGVILGASSGATIGSFAGPIGIVVGGVMGAVVGVWLFEKRIGTENPEGRKPGFNAQTENLNQVTFSGFLPEHDGDASFEGYFKKIV